LHAVDLHDGKQLPVVGLERRIGGDVDELELEVELRVDLLDDLERPFAETAVPGVEDGDAGYG
jgi:hypothetical protein